MRDCADNVVIICSIENMAGDPHGRSITIAPAQTLSAKAYQALLDVGIETVMINCNPETVSTDYDTSDRLYFEPLTHEDILNILERDKVDGVIVQFGGQTPLNLASGLVRCGTVVTGTPLASIDIAKDREKYDVKPLQEYEVK